MRRLASLFFLLSMCLLVLSGCAQMMGQLRKDFDDSEAYVPPTVGGAWTEGGHLNDEDANNPYNSVGHSQRGLASAGGRRGGDAWVTPDHVGANRRDLSRGLASEGEGGEDSDLPSFSNTPAMAPPVKRLYKNGNRATRSDFVDEGTSEGSLWASDGQTNYYFTKNKIRGVGDIVTINLEEAILKDTFAEVRRTLSPREKEKEILLAQERMRAKALGLDTGEDKKDGTKKDSVSSSQASAKGSGKKDKDAKPVDESQVDIPHATVNDIDVSKSLEIKVGDTMMSEIVERYPNGNYKVRGTKRVRYGAGTRLITLVGVVKGTDISEDDFVNSGKLYEYRLESIR